MKKLLLLLTVALVTGNVKAQVADVPLGLASYNYFLIGDNPNHQSLLFTYALKNRTAKAIKLIDASLRFTDRLDQVLTTVQLPPDDHYSPGELSGDYVRVRHYPSSDAQRMLKLNPHDVIAHLIVQGVVVEDNGIWKAQP